MPEEENRTRTNSSKTENRRQGGNKGPRGNRGSADPGGTEQDGELTQIRDEADQDDHQDTGGG